MGSWLRFASTVILALGACAPEPECEDVDVDVDGNVSDYLARDGAVRESYSVARLVECPRDPYSIAVTGTGTRAIALSEADAFFDPIVEQLNDEGIYVGGPGMTASECFNGSRTSRYLFFLQISDWRVADRAVDVLGRALADRSATVGIWVGIPFVCAL